MRGHQQIDPALSASAGNANIQPAPARYEHPPPQFQQQQRQQQAPNSNVGVYPAQSPSNPYYGYPTPQTHTPLQPSTGAQSIASGSNQASPQDATPQYQQLAQDGIDNSQVSDGNDAAAGGDDSKRPRACEACRGLKVRCDQDPAHSELPCRRCAKAGRQCVITAPSRKRQKKADSRVAELEKKLDHLTAVLQQQQQPGGSIQYGAQYGQAPTADMQGRAYAQAAQQLQQYNQPSDQTHDPPAMQPPAKRRRTDEDPQRPSTADVSGEPSLRYAARSNSELDISKRFEELNQDFEPSAESMRILTHNSPDDLASRIHALVSPPLCVQIFNRYVEKLAPHMPAVVFPPGTQAEQIWKEKPTLYACILSAASYGILHYDVTKQLALEAIKVIAEAVVVNGAKSIELIQAMQVLALWYKPPEKSQQTNFYQIIHMAAVMAIDIGLGKRFNPVKARRGFGGPEKDFVPGPHPHLPINSDTLEARRAWLGCYYLCASASMVLRRPNLVHWTKYMEECVQILETSSEAESSDKFFCQHIKIQHICEEVSVQFLMDDNTASICITDPKVTYALNVLENDLKEWSQKIPPELKSHPSLKFFEHVASLYLHEIALHFNHNVEDFRLPFTEESLKSVANTSEKLTQNQIAALEACRQAAHGILDGMLAFDTETTKALPMLLFFVRCTYAIVVLIKMHVAVTTPGSEISKMMTAEDINVDHYLDSLIDMYTNVPAEQDYRPHPKILRILSVLRDWFTKHKENVAAQARGDAPPHSQGEQPGQTQTPLDLLAQTATATNVKTDQSGQAQGNDHQNWTFNTPFPVDYTQQPHPSHSDSQFPIHQQGNNYQHSGANYGTGGEFDPNNAWLWGSNFQQAMDLNLADMAGVTGGGMDGLFLGNGLAPFDFNGETFQ